MKKINRDGIRALILETIEEMALDEEKQKEKVEEADEVDVGSENPPVDPGDETAAAGRGAREQDPSEEEVAGMQTPEMEKEKAKIIRAFEFYQGLDDLPILISTIETTLKYCKSLLPQENPGQPK